MAEVRLEKVTKNFGKGKVLLSYLLFTLLTGIGLSAFSPYMQLYILSGSFLGQSAQIYTLVIIVIAVASISSQLFWGKFIERVGNRKTILLSGAIISFVPLLVAYTRSIVILFFPIILLYYRFIGSRSSQILIFNRKRRMQIIVN